jgi:signal transduction histidine kinase
MTERIEAHASYKRLQKRIIDHGEFQMKQTIVLQDDEIKRLRARLLMFKEWLETSDSGWAVKMKVRRQEVEELSTKIRKIAEHKKRVRASLVRDHKSAMKKCRAEHQGRILNFNTDASKRWEAQGLSHQFNESQVLESLEKSSEEIERLKTEFSDLKSKESDELRASLARLKLHAKTRRVRVDELSDQISKTKKEIIASRETMNKSLEELKSKIRVAESQIRRVSKTEDSTAELDPENLARLDTLRRDVNEARDLVLGITGRIDLCQSDFMSKKREYYNEKRQLESVLEDLRKKNKGIGIIEEEFANQLENMRNLEGKLNGCDAELKNLREKNIRLRRRVHDVDFRVNGRSGEYQRSSDVKLRVSQSVDW